MPQAEYDDVAKVESLPMRNGNRNGSKVFGTL